MLLSIVKMESQEDLKEIEEKEEVIYYIILKFIRIFKER